MRRMGPETSETRIVLMDAVEAVMRQKGYGALTARNVAEAAGLKHQLVYYYFCTMDDLLLAVYRRRTRRMLERIEHALADERPLTALWRTYTDAEDSALTVEFMALSNHNAVIGAETVKFGEQMRHSGLDRLRSQSERAVSNFDPLALTTIIRAIASVLGMEAALGISGGHRETQALVEQTLAALESINVATGDLTL